MRLYLVQHGEALATEVDPQRPLSEQGRSDVQRLAAFLDKAGVRVSRVVHSGKERARETAELLAAGLAPGVIAESRAGIDPLDPTERVAKEAEGWSEDTMLVGHLPFMARLASRLVAGREEPETIGFRPGSLACFERNAGGRWILVWMIRPELLR